MNGNTPKQPAWLVDLKAFTLAAIGLSLIVIAMALWGGAGLLIGMVGAVAIMAHLANRQP